MSREASSSRFFTRNVVEASENEFESPSTPSFFPPSRTPLDAITDPSQYGNDAEDQGSQFDLKGKVESARTLQHRLHERRVEGTDRIGGLNLTNVAPRLANRHGKTISEPNSVQSTPARSGSRASFGGVPYAPGRAPQLSGGKSGLNCSASLRVPRALPMIDNSDAFIQVPHFELVEDSSFWADRNVQVLIRIRPLSTMERASQGYSRCLRQESAQTLVWLGHPETRFTFDHIASETISQEKLFRVVGLPMVENCMSGYNSCMFAYGQTGSGKTYTMMGQIYPVEGQLNADCGITPRIFEYLFQRIRMEEQSRRHEKLRFSCKCSFLEIYNEQITDLLEPSSTNLQLREDIKKGVYVENLTECSVQTVDDVLKLLFEGAANRKIAATCMNSESSRSHSVFTCIIESQWENDSTTHFRFARLNLVDLAGSERQKSSGAEGDRLKEAANINRSLSTLGLVIMSLVDLAQGKHRHVPYRDSRLTFLLQDSLGGNSKTTIIANVSPSICATNETLSTLKFGQRAKLIQNNAKVNEDSSGDVTALQHEIQKLKGQLSLLMKPHIAPGIDEYTVCLNADNSDHGLKILGDDFEMPCIKKKTQRMRAVLLGALRREKKAENIIHKLEAEIEQLNRLIRQREEDAQCTRMMLRFREEKIKKLESLVTREISAEKVLMDENSVLKEENQLLQAKLDRNPELTRFALENTRLFEQLQQFQGFYEEGERETLLNEVEELREQLLEVLEGKNMYGNYERQGKNTLMELQECKNMNSELMREVNELRAELNKFLTSDSATNSLLCGPNNCGQRGAYSLVRSTVHSDSEDEMAFHTPEADVTLEKLKEQKISAVVLEPGNFGKELMDAKLLVNAMEAEQMDLIKELQCLREENDKYVKLMGESAPISRSPCTESQSDNARCPEKESNKVDIKAVQARLNSLNDDLEKARVLNEHYETERASHLSCQQQAELVREQVELETSSTIIHLQEEIMAIQNELNEKVCNLVEENVKLKDKICTQEKKVDIINMEWEKATLDLTGFILDGSRSLKDASRQVENIASSFFPLNCHIVDQVERVAKVCIDKEEKILALERSLEDAQKMVAEMDLKLYSLKEAVRAFGEYWQPSSNGPAEVVAELCSFLDENIRMRQMSDPQSDFKHNPISRAENSNGIGLKAIKCISNCNSRLQNNAERNIAPINPAASAKLSGPICETEGFIVTEIKQAILSAGLTADNLVLSHNEANHAKSLFQRVKEVQPTIEEADCMLNTSLNANESTKALNISWRRANEELLAEKASLIEEIEHLRNMIRLKERENMALCDQLHETLVDVDSSMSLLEGCCLKMRKEVDEKFESLRTGVSSLGKDLLSLFPDLRKSVEDTCALMLENDFISFATYLCQVGNATHGSSILNVVGGIHSSRNQERFSIMKYFQKSHGIGKENLVACSVKGIEQSGSGNFKCSKDQIDLPLWLQNANCSLKKELERKEVLVEGLLFDLHLLQESASEMKDFKDESEKLTLELRQARHELDKKTEQIDDLLIRLKNLEINLVGAENALSVSTSNFEQAKEEIDSLLEQNAEMRMLLKELYIEKTEAEEQVEEQRQVIKGLEKEVLSISVKNDFPFCVEGPDDFRKIVCERDNLREEIHSLNHKLEMAHALADEKEAIAVETLQMSEASKLYAEQKEEEVKILERSVEELERTISMLEKKVYEMDEEVERHRAIRYSLEHELEALRQRLSRVEHFTNASVPTSRSNSQTEDHTSRSLEDEEPSMRFLQEESAELRREIELYKQYISEVVLHSEAQASQYQQKYKILEAMFQEIKKDASSTSEVASENKVDRSSARTRGSASPFRCISSLVQQMNLEKDQELSNAQLRIEELETLAANRQKEVCVLNTRLAAAESMTHDVIRDLLGVKLDIANYADILEHNQIQKLVEEAHQQADEFLAKEQDILELKKQVHDLIQERESCITEINERDAELLKAKLSIEQLKERDLLLSAQNGMLKKDKSDLLKTVAELDDPARNTQATKINHKQVHPITRIKEGGSLQVSNVQFAERLQRSDKLLSRANDGLASYHASNGARPHAGKGPTRNTG